MIRRMKRASKNRPRISPVQLRRQYARSSRPMKRGLRLRLRRYMIGRGEWF